MHTQSFPHRAVLTIALIASLCGSAEGAQPRRDAKEKPLTPEQSTCLNRAAARQRAQAAEFAKRHLDAMKAQRSTVELTLQERRMNEAACLEEAKCFGGGELVYGVMFDACLERVEGSD